MNGERVRSTAAQRMLHARYGIRTHVGMSDVIDMTANVMRDRARRLLRRRPTEPVFELLIVNDELAALAACLSDRAATAMRLVARPSDEHRCAARCGDLERAGGSRW